MTLAVFGRVTNDPETIQTEKMAITTFDIVVNRSARKRGTVDEWEEKPNFIRLKLFKQQAEYMGRELKRGDMVAASGELELEKFKDKNDVFRMFPLMIVHKIESIRGPRHAIPVSQQSDNPDAEPAQPGDDLPF